MFDMAIETNQKVPEKSLCCGADYLGGHALPGQPMRFGLRVFYKCGASLSVHHSAGVDNAWFLLSKNCFAKEEKENGSI
jgi:hypothetical protein